MKAKVTRGGGFRGALDYVFDKGPKATGDKNPEIVGGNLAGQDPRSCAKEFAAVRKLRPDIEKPVWHCSLSLPPGDRLAGEKWDEVATDFMATMGFPTDTPYTAVRHQDTDKDHIHIVASRISLGGEVWLGRWEARRAIEATQELEKKHGLTLTPGLGDVRAEIKALTRGEINMAANTRVEPPRQNLQRIVDRALKDAPGALEFAERLQKAGVEVRPNIASTGKMNGFSYKLDGIPFKSGDIGKGYTWAGLLNKGLTYEQIRDGEGLEQLRATAADSGRGADAAADHSADERQFIPTTGDNIERDGQGARATPTDQPRVAGHATNDIDRNVEGLGASDRDQSRAAELARGDSQRGRDIAGAVNDDSPRRESSIESIRQDDILDASDIEQSHSRTADAGRGALEADLSERGYNRRYGADGQGYGQEHRDGDKQDRRSSDESIQHGSRQPAQVVETMADVDNNRGGGRSTSDDWSKRFRQASASQRRAEEQRTTPANNQQSNEKRNLIDKHDFKQINPTTYLENRGYTVKKEGRHLSAQVNGDEIYRLTEKDDGTWLWCDNYYQRGGDNIDLVRDIEPGTKFTDAVYKINDGQSLQELQQRRKEPVKHEPPRVPLESPLDQRFGQDYLKARGISQDTIKHAEKAGMVQYTDGAVLFVGRDQSGQAQNVTRRAVEESEEVQKRDLKGSDKQFAPILPGDPSKVWIVEGGTDALALHDIAKRKDQPPPTVIISGGANVRSFLDNPEIQEILRRADKVTICGENEKDPQAQARSDAGHQRQADRVQEITGKEPEQWTPENKVKDLADLNTRQQTQGYQAWQQMDELRHQRQQMDEQDRGQEPEPDHSPGMSR